MTDLSVDITVVRGDFRVAARFEISGGTTLALLGPNGAGKSTTVAAIAGSLPPTTGRVSLGGRILDDTASGTHVPPESRRVGVVHQDHLLFPHLSVLDNVSFSARSRGHRREEAASEARSWLDRVGLAGLADRRPSELSGGQAQRVALARALASDPQALLLDEPLAALDVTSRAETRRLLGEHLAAFPGPRLLITHEPTEAFLLADRVAIVEHGEIVQMGEPDEIRRSPRTTYAADLAGINLVRGVAASGTVTTPDGHEVTIADSGLAGPVLLTIHPRMVGIHPHRPDGSPRNVWQATITAVEPIGDRVRVVTEGPIPLTAEVTTSSVDRLGLRRGAEIWIAVKATEIATEQE